MVLHKGETYYDRVRSTGFVYGHVIAFDTVKPVVTKGWTSEEISKVALLNTLYTAYTLLSNQTDAKQFIASTLLFYRQMNPEGFNLFRKVLPGNSASAELEKIIDERVQTNDNIISKNFSHILTNALLFEDVLAYRQYLLHGAIPHNYLKKLEETIVSIVTLALSTKSQKSNYDELLVKLFEASVRYTKFSKVNIEHLEALELHYFSAAIEKYYLVDMAGLALWSDGHLDQDEKPFLYKLAGMMHVDSDFVDRSIKATDEFISRYKHEIPYFQYSNPVKHFYDHATQMVVLLISRNKNRLIKELSNNRDLMVLLTHSTHRSLEDKEKKKVKKQLLEICKTVPSLTIFLLPGGSLLVPILIKFIPKMLPSAFNENLDDA